MKTNLPTKWYPAISVDDIPRGEGRRVYYKNYTIALFNLGAEFFAVDNLCPHKGGPLADGIVAGKAVFCPLHNLKIDLGNGCALNGGEGQVKTYPVKVMDQKVYVAFEEGQLQAPESKESEKAQVSSSTSSLDL